MLNVLSVPITWIGTKLAESALMRACALAVIVTMVGSAIAHPLIAAGIAMAYFVGYVQMREIAQPTETPSWIAMYLGVVPPWRWTAESAKEVIIPCCLAGVIAVMIETGTLGGVLGAVLSRMFGMFGA